MDFSVCLENSDMALNILMRLDDPADLVRASAVSPFWRHLVIANALLKQLCLRIFPQVSSNSQINVSSSGVRKNVIIESSNAIKTKILERDHQVYASLLQALSRSKVSPRNCIAYEVSDDGTEIDPYGIRDGNFSYWSSRGGDPDVPEILTYRLKADISIVTEIHIQPCRGYWELPGHPIFSIKSVRVGHSKTPSSRFWQHDDHNLVWTYTSPAFPMKVENGFEQFKLSQPVLCIGGYLQIELLGRRKSEIDGLFYMRIDCIRVLGLPLKPPAFDIKILKPSGNFLLKCHPQFLNSTLELEEHDDDDCSYMSQHSHMRQQDLRTKLYDALATRRRCLP